MADTHKDGRAVFLRDLGVTMEARFIPQSQSRNRDETEKSLNWVVTIKRGEQFISTDYMQGIGHVPGRPQSFARTLYEQRIREEYDKASEDGRYLTSVTRHPGSPMFGTRKPLPGPTLDDVLYCLVMDAEAASETFEDWCANFGYDTDSRKAEATYNACVQIGIKLRNLLGGGDKLQRLRDLFEDF